MTNESVFGLFEKAYVINLDSRPDRLEQVSRRLRRIPIQFERFPAIRPASLDGFTNLGYHGATLSHLALWKHIKAQRLANALIFEDDVVLRDDVSEQMKVVAAQLPKIQWDVLYLGVRLISTSCRLTANLFSFRKGCHLHAYAINAGSVNVLIDMVEANLKSSKRRVVDLVLSSNQSIRKVHTQPILAVQAISPSDTGGATSRLSEYFSKFSEADFLAHCQELREMKLSHESIMHNEKSR